MDEFSSLKHVEKLWDESFKTRVDLCGSLSVPHASLTSVGRGGSHSLGETSRHRSLDGRKDQPVAALGFYADPA